MAEALDDIENPLNCPICLNLLKDPVTTSCGHSFCMDCIKRYWDQEVLRGVNSCPTCRTTFNQRPALSRSKVLADILLGMKQECPSKPGDMKCDVCIGRKVKAIKSCLVCMASYCQTHIRPHYESKAFKVHKLVNASPNLQKQICPQHHKALEIYCYNDRKCICVVCMWNHSGHKTVSAAAEMAQKQEEMKMKKRDFIKEINNIDKKVQQFKEAVISHKCCAQAAVDHSDRIFNQLVLSIQKMQAEVRDDIRAQENEKVRDAESHIQILEQEICKLQNENCKLDPLLDTDDHIYFFQNCNSFSSGILHCNSSRDVKNLTFEKLEQSLSELKHQLDKVCEEHMDRILNKVADVQIWPQRYCHSDMEMGIEVDIWSRDDDDDDDDDDDGDVDDLYA